MTRRWTDCSSRWSAAGLTLIEVVAAIAIMGTILVGIVMAQARHTRQLAQARQVRALVDEADALIASWALNLTQVPVDAEGAVADGRLRWRTRAVENEPIEEVRARVVRVEFFIAVDGLGEQGVGPDFVVDLVVPVIEKEASEEGDDERRGGGGGGA